MREQVRRTIAAGRRLAGAHRELARAELAIILDDAKRVALLAGIAVALLAFIGLLLPVGMALFLGEWIFGSIGWGILHGVLFSVATAVILALAALRISRGYLVGMLVLATLVGVVVGVVLGLAWPNAGYARLGESLVPGIEAGVRPLAVGVAIWAALVGLLGLLVGVRGGAGSALAGLVGGAILGVPLGAFTAISFSLQVGAAVGVAVALVAWPALAALGLRGYDWEELKRRFVPQASIDAARETMEFVQARLPGRKEDEA